MPGEFEANAQLTATSNGKSGVIGESNNEGTTKLRAIGITLIATVLL